MFDDVDPTELRRALVSLCERLGVEFSVRAFESDYTRNAMAGYDRDGNSLADEDDEYMDDPDAEDDELEEDEEDVDDEEDDLEDEDMERGGESDYIRVADLEDWLSERGIEPQHTRSAEPVVDADAVEKLREAFALTR